MKMTKMTGIILLTGMGLMVSFLASAADSDSIGVTLLEPNTVPVFLPADGVRSEIDRPVRNRRDSLERERPEVSERPERADRLARPVRPNQRVATIERPGLERPKRLSRPVRPERGNND